MINVSFITQTNTVIIIVNGLKSEIRNKSAKNDASSTSSGGGSGNPGDSGATLFVACLPYGVSADDVRKFLQEKIPNAQNVRVPTDRDKNVKGIAFVELGSDADVTSIINQVSNLEMRGTNLRVNESIPREIGRPFYGINRGGSSGGGFGGGNFGGSLTRGYSGGGRGRGYGGWSSRRGYGVEDISTPYGSIFDHGRLHQYGDGGWRIDTDLTRNEW